jgi:hypothetical protein
LRGRCRARAEEGRGARVAARALFQAAVDLLEAAGAPQQPGVDALLQAGGGARANGGGGGGAGEAGEGEGGGSGNGSQGGGSGAWHRMMAGGLLGVARCTDEAREAAKMRQLARDHLAVLAEERGGAADG